MQCHYVELWQYHYQTTQRLQPLKIFVALHVFLVLIISSHDKLWGLPRRVFTLFISYSSVLHQFFISSSSVIHQLFISYSSVIHQLFMFCAWLSTLDYPSYIFSVSFVFLNSLLFCVISTVQWSGATSIFDGIILIPINGFMLYFLFSRHQWAF